METLIKSLLLSIGMILSTKSFAGVCTATVSGNWNNPAIWSCGTVPGCGDQIVIPAGISVIINTNIDLDEGASPACNSPVQFIVFGTMQFQAGRRIKLSCGSTVEIMVGGQMRHGAGGGASNTLDICGAEEWRAGDGHVPGYRLFGTPSPMPTTLVSFDATIDQNNLTANWTVDSERMVDFYSVQVSNDYTNWTEVATVRSVGDHSASKEYSTSADLTRNNATYVRLVVNDLDGTSQTLDTRTVKNETSVEIYPNPANTTDNIKMLGLESGSVIIYDQQGSLVAESSIENNTLNLSELQLKQGVYHLKIADSGQMIRLLIQ